MAEGILSRCCMTIVRLTPVLFVTAIIAWSYYAYVVHMCIYTVSNIPEKVIYLIVYHPLLIMMVWCFVMTILTKPATVPKEYHFIGDDLEKLEKAANQRELLEQMAVRLSVQCRSNNGAVRFCTHCKCIKPDRSHHCSICQRCILKMDHHCPWVNNCICFSNYKFFVLFISYSLIYCLFVSATSFQYFVKFFVNVYGGHEDMTNLHNVFLFFVGIVFVLSLAGLLCYHSSLIVRNRTTLEAFRAPTFRSGPDRNGFSHGTYANFMEVFGKKKLLWFIPVFTALGDGAKYTARIAPASVGYQSMNTSNITLEPYAVQTMPVMVQPLARINETSLYPTDLDEEEGHLLSVQQAHQKKASTDSLKRTSDDPYHITPVQHKRM